MSQSQQPNPKNEKSLTKAETIALLQQTITELNVIVSKLNTESIELPSTVAVESLVTSTEQLAQALVTIPKTRSNPPTQTIPQPTSKSQESTGLDRILPSFSSLQTGWDKVLTTVRSLLPPSLRDTSDWVLTGILTGSIVAVLLASVLLFPQSPKETVVIKPSPEISPPEVQLPSPVSPDVVETPPELVAPDNPEPVTIAPSPPPELLLTPEQSLIVAIQEQVNDITKQYPEGILSSIEADFLGSRLQVILEDNWYELNSSRQDRLADSIWQRSQRLDFRKLEIIDRQGTLIARNPVVGNEVVILQRTKAI